LLAGSLKKISFEQRQKPFLSHLKTGFVTFRKITKENPYFLNKKLTFYCFFIFFSYCD